MTDMGPEVTAIADAIQAYANEVEGRPVILDTAVVVYELVLMDDDGQVQRKISYTVPTDNFSLSSIIGLCSAGTYFMRRDLLEGDDDD